MFSAEDGLHKELMTLVKELCELGIKAFYIQVRKKNKQLV